MITGQESSSAPKRPKKPKKKKKIEHGPMDILRRLGSGLEDDARGMLPGLAALGRSVASDPLDTGDKLARGAIGYLDSHYVDYALRGDLKGFAYNVSKNPDDYALDALSLVPFVGQVARGASLAGKAGKIAAAVGGTARATEASRAAAKAAGASRVERMGKYVPAVREIGTKARVATDGTPTYKLVSSSPIRRGVDKAVDLGLEALPVGTPAVGSYARKARVEARKIRRVSDKRALPLKAVAARSAALSADEEMAAIIRHAGVDANGWKKEMLEAAAEMEDGGLQKQLNSITQQRVNDRVIRMVSKPTKRMKDFEPHLKNLTNVQMRELMLDNKILKGDAERTMLERRVMLALLSRGSKMVDEHPTLREATPNAERAGKAYAAKQEVRGQRAEVLRAQADAKEALVNRIENDLTDRVMKLRGKAWRTAEGGVAEDAARKYVVRKAKAAGRQIDPDSMKALREWLRGAYNQSVYGSKKVTAAERAAWLADQKKAKARTHKGKGKVPSELDILAMIKKHGPWSMHTVRYIEKSGPMRMWGWRMLKEERKLDNSREGMALRAQDERLVRAGFHPSNRHANPVENDELADALWEQLEEGTGGERLARLAEGAPNDNAGSTAIDMEEAQSILEAAREADPNLSADPDLEEVAAALATQLGPPPYKTKERQSVWVNQAANGLMALLRGDRPVDLDSELAGLPDDSVASLKRIIGYDAEAEYYGVPFEDALKDTITAAGVKPTGLVKLTPEENALLAKIRKDRETVAQELLRDADRLEARKGQGKLPDDVKQQATDLRKRADKVLAGRTKVELDLLRRSKATQPVPLDRSKLLVDGQLIGDVPEEKLNRLVEEYDANYITERATKYTKGFTGNPNQDARVVKPVGMGAASKQLAKQNTGASFTKGTGRYRLDDTIQAMRQLVRIEGSRLVQEAAVKLGVVLEPGRSIGDLDKYVLVAKDSGQILAHTDAVRRDAEKLVKYLRESSDGEPVLGKNVLEDVRTATVVDMVGKHTDLDADIAAGNVVAVPRASWNELTKGMKATGPVGKWMDKGLDIFRLFVLNLAPRWVVNDVIGAQIMLTIKHGGPTMFRSQIEYAMTHKGKDAALKMLRKNVDDPVLMGRQWDTVIMRELADTQGQGLFINEGSKLGGAVNLTDPLQVWKLNLDGGIRRKYGTLLFRQAARVPRLATKLDGLLASDIPRGVLAITLLKPHVAKARKAGLYPSDMPDWDVADALLKENPAFADRIAAQVMDDLIDYGSLSPFERNVMRRIIPFYSWLRGMSLWMVNLGLDSPWRYVAATRVADTFRDDEDRLMPEMLRSFWFSNEGDKGKDRRRGINTQGMNPFGTPFDVADVVGGMAKGQVETGQGTPASILNPFIRAGIESAFIGRDLFTGNPIRPLLGRYGDPVPGGVPHRFAAQFVNTLPQVALYDRFRSRNDPKSPNSVYAGPWTDYLAGYMGAPLRTIDMPAAEARAYRDKYEMQQEGLRVS